MQTIIHIGAGHCSELESYLATEDCRIILIEPIPALAAKLAQWAKGLDHVVVVEAAITPDPANNQLHEFNLQEASSLRMPKGLKKLFPGLRTVKTHTVSTLTPKQLVAEYGPEPGQPAKLIIQAPGEEQAILRALIESDQLQYFNHLKITTNPEPLYEGSVAAEAIIRALMDYGYDVADKNRQDPDWISLELMRNPLKAELKNVLDELHRVKADRDTALNECDQVQQDNERLKTKLAELTNALEVQKQEQQALVSERDSVRQAKDALAKEIDGLRKEAAERKQIIADLQVAKDIVDAEKHALTEENSAIQRERDEALTQRDQHRQDKEKLDKKVADLTHSLEVQKQEQQALVSERDSIRQAKDALAKEIDGLRKEAAELKQIIADLQVAKDIVDAEKHALTEENSAIQRERDEALTQRDQAKVTCETVRAERDKARKERDQLKQEKEVLNRNKEELAETRRQMAKDLEQARARIKVLETEAALNAGIKQLQERMEYLFNQQTLQLEQAANALGYHVSQSTQGVTTQLQSFIKVQQRLGNNTMSLQYQGQKLLAEIALLINEQLNVTSYDLILDLGAGVSTWYLANQLSTHTAAMPRLNHHSSEETTYYVQPEDGDLPKRIVAFIHQRSACADLTKHLQQKGLYALVDIQFAPLVDYRLAGQDFLFYDAHRQLASIANLFDNRVAKFFVVIPLDQQPDSLTPEASLPLLLQSLGSHQLKLVLYPLQHSKAAGIKDSWQRLLAVRGIEFDLKEDQEADALLLTINP